MRRGGSHPVNADDLKDVKSFDDLAKLFHEKLEWPEEKWETFTGVPALYGIPKKELEGVIALAAVQKLSPKQEWGIFLVDFGANPLRRSSLRRILHAVATRARATHAHPTWPHDNILFICKHKEGFTLCHFRGDRLADAKLKSFSWSPTAPARTALENLNKLLWNGKWVDAWDVEALSKEFFESLSQFFFDTVDALKGVIPDESERRLFVQTLFNRLIFLRFVEKKGHLKFNGREDYLRALWEAGKDPKTPFWPNRLNALFTAVNHQEGDKERKAVESLIGDVVFLNGGLFDESPRFSDPALVIPDSVFEGLLGANGLFYRYNFTVEESSPLDVEVAVDPEVLGRVFEKLTISEKRHDTGSYYTPREIVQFMCREALVGYLESKGIAEEKVRKLVYEHDDSELTNQEGNVAFEALKAIKVVDPACGSGAYLLGMLQELYALFDLLRRDDRKFSDDPAKEAHERKLWIIENNLYGVDIQQFATNTAMLRLWLTLLVEDTGETPQPLPNLEYKIETGDSLLGPDPSKPVHLHAGSKKKERGQPVLYDLSVHTVVDELRRLREQYQNAHGPAKNQIKKELEAKLAELREKVTGSPNKDLAKFDWRVEFFDVFLNDPERRQPGFDAVIANPPYVRQELIKDQKPALRAAFGEFFCGTADLYTYFYARAVQLLKPGGMLAFISSNKWFRAAYGEKLRGFMAANTDTRSITDFGELPVFSAATFPMIFVAQRRGTGVSPVRGTAVHARDAGSHARDPNATGTDEITIRQGAYLPHWTREGGIYHVVFRLHDSLPQAVVREWLAERDDIRRNAEAQNRKLAEYEVKRLAELHSKKVEAYLDQGHGECYFKRDDCAKVMADALLHFNGDRYHVHAWCVMPNHVHVVVEPAAGHKLPDILHSWKSFTAHKINNLLGRTGDFWQPEYYDHLIRDEKDYLRCIQYVLDNPAAAGLKNWKWVGGGGGTGVPPVKEGDAEAGGSHARDTHVTNATNATLFTQVKSLDPPYPDVKALIEQGGFELPPDAIQGSNWTLADKETLARLRRMEASGVPLGEYVKGKIYYGIKTGFNEAFVIDGAKRADLIAEDPKSAEIIKPLAVGDDVRRWHIRDSGKWLIVTKIGVDMKRYPAIFEHLSRWKKELMVRQDQGEHWWELRACAYYAEFDKPKIVFPEIAMEPRFCFDADGTFTNNKAFIVPLNDLFLLAVLNSPWAWEYAGFACAALGDEADGGRVMLQWVNFQRLPIPRASDADRDAIAALVQKCLDAKVADPDADVSELEAEIDAIVERLYFGRNRA